MSTVAANFELVRIAEELLVVFHTVHDGTAANPTRKGNC
jgi:hypothetical protein